MQKSTFSLTDRVAIVTGGGTGIGRSIALEFAEFGADVVVSSRKLENLERVVDEVKALGRHSLAIEADITKRTDVDDLVQRVTLLRTILSPAPRLPRVAGLPPGSAGFQPAASSRKRRYEHRPRAPMPAIPGRPSPSDRAEDRA